MLTNSTTWERFSRKNITYLRIIKNDNSNPFQDGYLKNIYYFLCNSKQNTWDYLYANFWKNSKQMPRCTNARNAFSNDIDEDDDSSTSDDKSDVIKTDNSNQ